MTLYLVRHAHAGTRNPADPADHLRPLSRKGVEQSRLLAQALTRLGVRFHYLFTSPYPRAADTAAALALLVRGRRIQTLEALTAADYADLCRLLKKAVGENEACLCVVGHEPYLSELSSYLLTAETAQVKVHFRKTMVLRLEGELTAGAMSLHSALPPVLLKMLAKS